MIYGFAALLVFQLIGEGLAQALRLPLPGPLIGMLLLFAALVVRGRAPESVRDSANGLLQHMMLLFIPAVAGVMLHFHRVGQEWLPFVAAGIGGAAVTLVVTALTLRFMLRGSAAERSADAGGDAL